MSIKDILITGVASRLPGDLKTQDDKIRCTGKPIPDAVRHLLPCDGVAEYRFHPIRRWRFDYTWIRSMVALEVEGGVWANGRHTRGKGFVADIEKYNEAAIAGWCLLRCTPQQLESGEAGAWVARAIAKRTR